MEGFGINVIEAAACGRIVLASNIQGLSDAIQDGKNGFLLEPGNVDEWIKSIDDLMTSRYDRLTDFGVRAADFTRQIIARRVTKSQPRRTSRLLM